jgi:hypothetical protein
MSLIKKPTITEKKAAANQRNGAQSQGAATEEGKERIGAAQLRHGFYAKAQDVALRRLGEDPAHFEELLAGLREEFTLRGTLQQELVLRLARVLWLMDRADRSQEGYALRRARSADNGRDNRLHAQMMRLKMTAESLRSLAREVACQHYVTTCEDLEVMKKLHQEGVTTEMGEIALELFLQLQVPGTDEDGVDPEEKNRRVVNSIRSIFGLQEIDSPVELLTPAGERLVVRPEDSEEVDGPPDSEEDEDSDEDDRYPTIAEEDWKVRERARKLLRNILNRQVEVCEMQRKGLLKESLAGLSPYELAAEIAPSPADALLMRRMQDANMREVRRLTNLLLKIKRREPKIEPLEPSDESLVGHDISENKST